MIDSLDIRFAKELAKRLDADLQDQVKVFVGGSWIVREDAGATAVGAMSLYARLKGIQLALKRIEETHQDLTGPIGEKKKEKTS